MEPKLNPFSVRLLSAVNQKQCGIQTDLGIAFALQDDRVK